MSEAFWTPERVATLRRMWAEGATYAVIGIALGITRSCVAGKRKRLKLEPRAETQKPRAPRKPRQRVSTPRPPRTAVQAPEIVPDTATTFGHVTSSQCHYPFGDPRKGFDTIYCGAPVARLGMAYCARHYRAMYEPPEPSTNTRPAWRAA